MYLALLYVETERVGANSGGTSAIKAPGCRRMARSTGEGSGEHGHRPQPPSDLQVSFIWYRLDIIRVNLQGLADEATKRNIIYIHPHRRSAHAQPREAASSTEACPMKVPAWFLHQDSRLPKTSGSKVPSG